MKKYTSVRLLAAKVLQKVLEEKTSLHSIINLYKDKKLIFDKEEPLLKELCFGVLRNLSLLNACVKCLVIKKIKKKQKIAYYLLLTAIYSILNTRIPYYAIISLTVDALEKDLSYLKPFLNWCLREFLRKQDVILKQISSLETIYLHPQWIINIVKNSYPNDWESILKENNVHPPLWLRVNRLKISQDEYHKLLRENHIQATKGDLEYSLLLKDPISTSKLPKFEQGYVSVQDLSAQMATKILSLEDNQYVLDACAAPGGKTCAILEQNKVEVVAIDISCKRLEMLNKNLSRLGLNANVICEDVINTAKWFSGKLFDRILIDAPCSGSGVIRRRPDIKWIRNEEDVDALVIVQRNLLEALWPLLKPLGILVYATCSIFPQENKKQIERFLANHSNATLLSYKNQDMWQILPKSSKGDGFFYARIQKIG